VSIRRAQAARYSRTDVAKTDDGNGQALLIVGRRHGGTLAN
jgi:hypothetical protein